MSKSFIITVDTEGDNLWAWKVGDKITTRNAEFIPRFQALCDKFGFKPVYLTNYEMALSDTFVANVKQWLIDGKCEIGVHLHAWNNLPYYALKGPYNGQPYLIEYPEKVMREKFSVIYTLIKDRFGIIPISHRAGRWAMNETYFRILKEFGIKVDCSYTPLLSWKNSKGVTCGGSDYRNVALGTAMIDGVFEVPLTVRSYHHFTQAGSYKHKIRALLLGCPVRCQAAGPSERDLMVLINRVIKEPNTNYIEFMLHSSELMPGGSPYFKTEEDIEHLYRKLRRVFSYAHSIGYHGATLDEYYKQSHENV